MADQFTVSVTSQRLMSRLQKLSLRVHNVQPPLTAWGDSLKVATQLRWQQQIDPGGRPWKPLAPSTVARKRRLNLLPGILRSSDRLRQSISVSVRNDRLRLGTAVPYAPFVAKQRKFLGITDDDVRAGLAIMREHLKE
jgi:phage gpG-like protein